MPFQLQQDCRTPARGTPAGHACRPARAWRAWRWGSALAALLLLLAGLGVARGQEAELEYRLKAAFLYNFLKFTQWPTNKYVPAQPAMVVGCLAEDPAAPLLARFLEGKTVNGIPIQVVTFQETQDPRSCHVLFLGRSRKGQIEDTLARLRDAPVLTVGETDLFAHRGGIINFVRHERTFRFEINLEAAEKVRLRISSDLASMATIVKASPPK